MSCRPRHVLDDSKLPILDGLISSFPIRLHLSEHTLVKIIMTTTFLTLPSEIRALIYQRALQNSIIEIPLRISQVNESPRTIQYLPPTKDQLKLILLSQNHVISLLSVSRLVHSEVHHSIYSNIRVVFTLPEQDGPISTPHDNFSKTFTEFLSHNTTLLDLMGKVSMVCSPDMLVTGWLEADRCIDTHFRLHFYLKLTQAIRQEIKKGGTQYCREVIREKAAKAGKQFSYVHLQNNSKIIRRECKVTVAYTEEQVSRTMPV